MPTASKTISQVFEEFLTEQEARLSPSTFSKYGSIISLFESYLESYWPGHDQEEYNRSTKQGGTYCGTFAPDEISESYSEFLGYFMPRKVMCGKDTMKAAGTVTKKLAKWLVEKGYIEDTADVQERAQEATRDLPAAQEVLNLLVEYVDYNAPDAYRDTLEDHFSIKKIEPGTVDSQCSLDGALHPASHTAGVSCSLRKVLRCRSISVALVALSPAGGNTVSCPGVPGGIRLMMYSAPSTSSMLLQASYHLKYRSEVSLCPLIVKVACFIVIVAASGSVDFEEK